MPGCSETYILGLLEEREGPLAPLPKQKRPASFGLHSCYIPLTCNCGGKKARRTGAGELLHTITLARRPSWKMAAHAMMPCKVATSTHIGRLLPIPRSSSKSLRGVETHTCLHRDRTPLLKGKEQASPLFKILLLDEREVPKVHRIMELEGTQ